MIVDVFEEFAASLPAGQPVLGLDLGTKTLGIAASDLRLSTASPVEVIRRRKFGQDAERLLALAASRSACGLVLGLPRNMDGSEGPRCQSTRAFARNLSNLTPVPITFWDERLSTVAAERALIEADLTRKRRSEVIDAVAAAYILQGALDRIGFLRAEDPRPDTTR
ncbi:MAG: Holliday junction resolvase RuvX [Pseudomonadota bacterium]